MDKKTIAIQAGRYPEQYEGAVNPPIIQTSTVLFPTLKSYYEAEQGRAYYEQSKRVHSRDYGYGIAGTATSYALREAFAALEGADHCLVYPSGLNAITSTLTAFLKKGDHLLLPDSVYGPTRRFCHKELKRYGVESSYYDPLIGEGIVQLIQENTRIILLESPGSLTFEIQDIPAIMQAVQKVNPSIVTVIDNSWATPFYFSPFQFGIDVSIHAGTKYVGGHSDILLGLVNFNEKVAPSLYDNYHNTGVCVSPHECYLAQRGLRTMLTRLQAHEKTALSIANKLESHPKVTKILHPALPSFPQHAIWKRDFTGSTGLFSIILDQHYSLEKLSQMIDPMEVFGIGCSWGGYESLILALDPKGGRSVTKWEAEGSLIRIYTGLEAEEDIYNDLLAGLERL